MRAAFLTPAPGYWRPLNEKQVQELVPLLVLGTTGSDEEPTSGASELKAVEISSRNIQSISDIKILEIGVKNLQRMFLFQVNMLKPKRLNY